MHGAGSILAMNSTIRNNRALVKKRKTLKEIAREHPLPKCRHIYRYSKSHRKQLEKIKGRLMSRNLRLLKLKILAFVLIFGTGMASLAVLLLHKF